MIRNEYFISFALMARAEVARFWLYCIFGTYGSDAFLRNKQSVGRGGCNSHMKKSGLAQFADPAALKKRER